MRSRLGPDSRHKCRLYARKEAHGNAIRHMCQGERVGFQGSVTKLNRP